MKCQGRHWSGESKYLQEIPAVAFVFRRCILKTEYKSREVGLRAIGLGRSMVKDSQAVLLKFQTGFSCVINI